MFLNSEEKKIISNHKNVFLTLILKIININNDTKS